jgi:hypothetical protein
MKRMRRKIETFQAASDRTCELIHAIAELPATGLTGFVIKVYLRHRTVHGGTFEDPCAARSLGADADQYIDRHIEQSIIEDAVRFVPELAPLAANAISPMTVAERRFGEFMCAAIEDSARLEDEGPAAASANAEAMKADAKIIAAAVTLIPLYLDESEILGDLVRTFQRDPRRIVATTPALEMTAGEPEVIGFGEPEARP